jgi:peptide/nickel transport system permease protein
MILKLVIRRVTALLPLLLAVALCSFFLIRLAPGDFLSDLTANPQISEETISALREQYALDRPWQSQFAAWLGRVLRGDLGYSFACNCPVSTLIAERVFNTTMLALTGLLQALLFALPLGAFAAERRSRLPDRVLAFISSLFLSLPSFLLALLAVLLAAKTGWFPIGGVQSLDYEQFSVMRKLSDYLHHLILPAAVLAVRQMPAYFRQMRSSMLESLSQDYTLTARAKGLAVRSIIFKHAFRNAVNPIISMFGASVGSLLSGAFVVEVVMSWPGLGSLAVSSLLSRDLDALIACLIYAALLLALGNLLGDLLLAAADPRLRRPQA